MHNFKNIISSIISDINLLTNNICMIYIPTSQLIILTEGESDYNGGIDDIKIIMILMMMVIIVMMVTKTLDMEMPQICIFQNAIKEY